MREKMKKKEGEKEKKSSRINNQILKERKKIFPKTIFYLLSDIMMMIMSFLFYLVCVK